MRKVDLIRELLAFHDKMEDEILVRIVTRNENGMVVTEQTASIDSLGHFFKTPTTINITKANLSPEVEI